MKIIDIRETTVPVGSAMRNSSIAFDGMTASALAIITDQRGDGEALVGYAFDSIGRYAKGGLLRERFIPRLLAASSGQLLDDEGCIDPRLCFGVMMGGEKQGGHGERPGAVGLLDAALWDLRAKQKRQPLWRTLSHDHGRTPVGDSAPTYASCGHFSAHPGANDLRDEVKACLDAGYTTVKIKLGGRDAAEDAKRIDSALASGLAPDGLAVDINGQWRTGDIDWLTMVGSYGLAWVEEPSSPLDYAALASFCAGYAGRVATGGKPVFCRRCAQLAALWRATPGPGPHPGRHAPVVRPMRIHRHHDRGRARRLVGQRLLAARRPLVRRPCGGGLRPRQPRSRPRRAEALWRILGWRASA